jgi:hypothetical protein
MSEMECRVKPGRAPYNADGIQRNEVTTGTDPPQIPKEVRQGICIKLRFLADECLQPLKSLGVCRLIRSGGGPKHSVNQEQQGNQDLLTTLDEETSETDDCQVKPG